MSLSSSLSAKASSSVFASNATTGMTAPAPAAALPDNEATRECVSPSQSGSITFSSSSEGEQDQYCLRVAAAAAATATTGKGGSQPSSKTASNSVPRSVNSARRVMFPSDLLERAFATEALRGMQHQQPANKSSLVRRGTATKSSSINSTSGISQLCKGPMAEWAKLFEDGDDYESDQSLENDSTLSETSMCTDDEDEEEDASGSESEEETAMVQALVRAAFEASAASAMAVKCTAAAVTSGEGNRESKSLLLLNRHVSTSSIISSDSTTAAGHRRGLSSVSNDRKGPVRKKQRMMSLTSTLSVSTTEAEHQEMSTQQPQQPIALRFTASAPSLLKSMDNISAPVENKNDPLAHIKPDDFLRELLLSQESQQPEKATSSVKTSQDRLKYYKASELSDFFVPLTPQAIAGYDTALVQAVRRQDVSLLRAWHAEGRCLHAGNPYGETILHAAARRGATEVVRLLLHECHVPVRVCCDYQRTVLHDACWTVTPHWACIELLLDACPDLLFVLDRRGSTPLQYVPKEHWADWCRYLKQRHEQPCHGVNKSKLEPRELQVIVPVQDE